MEGSDFEDEYGQDYFDRLCRENITEALNDTDIFASGNSSTSELNWNIIKILIYTEIVKFYFVYNHNEAKINFNLVCIFNFI